MGGGGGMLWRRLQHGAGEKTTNLLALRSSGAKYWFENNVSPERVRKQAAEKACDRPPLPVRRTLILKPPLQYPCLRKVFPDSLPRSESLCSASTAWVHASSAKSTDVRAARASRSPGRGTGRVTSRGLLQVSEFRLWRGPVD